MASQPTGYSFGVKGKKRRAKQSFNPARHQIFFKVNGLSVIAGLNGPLSIGEHPDHQLALRRHSLQESDHPVVDIQLKQPVHALGHLGPREIAVAHLPTSGQNVANGGHQSRVAISGKTQT